MIIYPNAKINLGLHVVEKRADGFHNIGTVFYPIGWKDVLEVLPDETQASGVTLTMSGMEIPGDANDNLCVKAYYLISKEYPMPGVKAHLHKLIPTGAGLGGGSSDAAFFIRALNEVFELNLAWGEMHHYAKQLGADCSFFIVNKPMLGEGKGDQLEAVNVSLKGYHVVLVHPGFHVGTAEAYAGVRPQQPVVPLEELIECPVEEWNNVLKNDFEISVFEKYPAIASLKKELYELGAVYAAMSGSGSAVFGIFQNKIDLQNKFANCNVWQGTL